MRDPNSFKSLASPYEAGTRGGKLLGYPNLILIPRRACPCLDLVPVRQTPVREVEALA